LACRSRASETVLRRLGLGRLKRLDPPAPVVRYQRQRPGELVHIDTKKLGRIAGIGHRITGRRSGMVNRHRGIGWEYLHVAVDDASRLAYTEILPDERKASTIEIGDLRTELLRLAERGRVLVLLDACRSGAITKDRADTTVDASQLRAALAAANVTVLTSSSGKENSIEHRDWQNGAFTQVFLEALGQDADSDRNSVVSMTELTRYITAGVPRLVHEVDPERHQTPGVEMRFEHTIFAAGL
jgi:Integrase core domain/Caspase domain